MEHRWGDRVRSDVSVKLLADPASVGWGRIRDVSISGGFIETTLPLQPPSTLQLLLHSSSRSGRHAQWIRAIVVRCASDGVGVEWFDGDSEAVAAIVREARAMQEPFITRVSSQTGANAPVHVPFS